MENPVKTTLPPPAETGAARPERISTLQKRRRPIKSFAIVYIVLACLVLAGGQAWSRWSARQVLLHQAETETRNMARALAEQAEDTFKLVDTVLVDLVERVETDGAAGAERVRLRSLLAAHVRQMAPLQGLFVYDAAGRWRAHSADGSFDSFNNSDREYFAFHRQNRDRGPHIGAPLLSRSSNIWVIPVSRRLEHRDGSFAGVALATVKIDFFHRFYASFDVGQEGVIVLALDNGTMLLRRPFSQSYVGASIAGGPVFTLVNASGAAGSAMLKSRLDNVERLYSFQRLPTYPLLVAVARSKQELLQEWWTTSVVLGVVVAVLIGAWLALGLRLVRQIGIRDRLETELKQAKLALENRNALLASLALEDALTGLANRRQFDQALAREFKRARRSGEPLALVMIDVDHFKSYNDRYGHPGGDACLKIIAAAIESGKRRPSDLAARYGGEEFALLLPATSVAGAVAVAQAIRAALQEALAPHAGSPFGVVTVSAGAHAMVPRADSGDAFDLVRLADRALYVAKSGGRNRVGTVPE